MRAPINHIRLIFDCNQSDKIKEADMMLSKENEFCDLLMAIKNGEKDA